MIQTVPKISVITVCYNAAKIISKTINSVLEQSHSAIEYIIVDGNSIDDTKEIVRSFGARVSHFFSEADTGIYDAMNKGIKNASGDLIVFLNAGDYYVSSDVLSYAASKINLGKADIFFARYIWQNIKTKDIILSDNSATEYDWDFKNSNFPHPATFYKRSVFSKIDAFDETYKILADFEWNARALIKHRVPFQYIDIITALFTTDGMSNNESNGTMIDLERSKIIETYFQPSWLFDFVSKYGRSNFIKRAIAKIYSKRLNRIW